MSIKKDPRVQLGSSQEEHGRAHSVMLPQEPAGVQSGSAPLLWSVEEAAARLRLSRATLVRMIARHEIASVKAGGRRLLSEGQLHAYVRRLEAEAEQGGWQ